MTQELSKQALREVALEGYLREVALEGRPRYSTHWRAPPLHGAHPGSTFWVAS
jgi:hypothetical protein